MSATAPHTGRKPRDIYEWAGGSAVNFEPVVIPASVGLAIDAGLLRPEASTDGAERGVDGPTVPDGAEGPECHHDPVWTESGVCMACDGSVGAAATVADRRQLGDDAGGGRL